MSREAAAQLLTTSALFGSRQFGEQLFDTRAAPPTRARQCVVFKRAIARGFMRDGAARSFGKRGASEVGVQHDAAGVDDMAQAERRFIPTCALKPSCRLRQQHLARGRAATGFIGRNVRLDTVTQFFDDGARQRCQTLRANHFKETARSLRT